MRAVTVLGSLFLRIIYSNIFNLLLINLSYILAVLYLTDYYIFIAGKMGGFIFRPLLFIVSIIGLIAAYKEFKNNGTFAVIVGGLAIINSIVGILLWALGNM